MKPPPPPPQQHSERDYEGEMSCVLTWKEQ